MATMKLSSTTLRSLDWESDLDLEYSGFAQNKIMFRTAYQVSTISMWNKLLLAGYYFHIIGHFLARLSIYTNKYQIL